jgi:hypothetical protein
VKGGIWLQEVQFFAEFEGAGERICWARMDTYRPIAPDSAAGRERKVSPGMFPAKKLRFSGELRNL